MFMCDRLLYGRAKLVIRVADNNLRAANHGLLLAIAASSVAAWNGRRDRFKMTAAIYKAVISSSITLFDSNPCLAKPNGTANAFACLFEKFKCESQSGTANGLFNSLHRAEACSWSKVKFWDFATRS